MAVRLISQKSMNTVVAHHREVKDEVHDEGRRVKGRASRNLSQARATTRWHKIHGPDRLTSVTGDKAGTDYLVFLNAPNAMAIEFGHAPSGVFGPGGELGDIPTKAPHGLYILARAAGLGGKMFIPKVR